MPGHVEPPANCRFTENTFVSASKLAALTRLNGSNTKREKMKQYPNRVHEKEERELENYRNPFVFLPAI